MQHKHCLVTAAIALGLIVYGSALAGGGHHGNTHYGYSVGYSHHGHGDDDLLIGLLVGGLIGYAISHTYQEQDAVRDYPPPRTSRHPPHVIQYRTPDTSCLQVREYLTVITVDGQVVDAYGDACLQPDGSWRRGPAKLAIQ